MFAWLKSELFPVYVCINFLSLCFRQVSNMYDETHKLMSSEPVKNYVPFSWISMVQVKAHHFGALSHFHAAQALIEHIGKTSGRVMPLCFHWMKYSK